MIALLTVENEFVRVRRQETHKVNAAVTTLTYLMLCKHFVPSSVLPPLVTGDLSIDKTVLEFYGLKKCSTKHPTSLEKQTEKHAAIL
jgi:hypothetical protein